MSVLVFVYDGESPSNDYYLNIAVNPINDVPEIINQPAAISILENNGAGYTPRLITVADVTINDPDGGSPTVTVLDGANYTHATDQEVADYLSRHGDKMIVESRLVIVTALRNHFKKGKR